MKANPGILFIHGKRKILRADFLELRKSSVILRDILFSYQFFNIINTKATSYFQENREITNLRSSISKFK